MKKILLTLVIAATVLTVLPAGTTGSITLTGTVDGILTISVTPDAVASNLNLSTSQTDLPVAVIVERSNRAAGYTVTLESANAKALGSDAALLQGSGSNTATLAYTMKYGGQDVLLLNGQALITDTTQITTAQGVSKTLSISYTSDGDLMEGEYSDTLTLTIAAK